jgi:hypothetical protein
MDHFASTAQKGRKMAKKASGEPGRCRGAPAFDSDGTGPAVEAALPFSAVVLLMLAADGGERRSK